MASDLTARLGGARSTLAYKAPCRVGAVSNISLTGTQTIDGVAVVAEDRVLVMGQTDQTENGVYTVKATAWQRARDFDGTGDVVTGTRVYVHSGTDAVKGAWVLTAKDNSAAKQHVWNSVRVSEPQAAEGQSVGLLFDYVGTKITLVENSATPLSLTITVQHSNADTVFIADAGTIELL
jgi:hypothetical protein